MMSRMEALTETEVLEKLKVFPQWKYENKAIYRTQSFSKYLDSLEFVNRVGKAAENADHHPDISMKYKVVTIRYWTHKAHGVTGLDFKMAAEVENIIKALRN